MPELPIAMTPVQPAERIEVVDILRGFALLGIFVANMPLFSIPFAILRQGPGYWTDPVDKAAQLLTRIAAVGEFYVPFSFLFGWGLAIQMERAASRGVNPVPLTLRRLFVLLLIGLVHIVFIWSGDILTSYALLGFPLLLFRTRSDRAIIAVACICLLIPILLSMPGPAAGVRQAYTQTIEDLRPGVLTDPQVGAYTQGGFLEMIVQRMQDLKSYATSAIYRGPYVFGLFLMGVYVGRRGVFQNISAHLPRIRRAMWLGLIVGLFFNSAFVLASVSPELVLPAYQEFVRVPRIIGGTALCCFYCSAIILLVQKETWRTRLAPLASVGRMTLSNYLLQSLVCTTIFYSYGLGLYGKIGPAIGLVLSAGIFLIQVGLSKWWLARCRFGPMEWLWRTLTYLKPQPIDHLTM